MAIVNRTTGAFAFTTSHVITIPAVASGNSLLVLVTCGEAHEPTAVTDNGGASPTYTEDVAGQQLEGTTTANPRAYIFRRNNITDAPTSVTITTAAGVPGGRTYNILEIDNLADAGPTQSNVSTRAFATTATATVTTATANEIGVAFAGMGGIIDRTINGSAGWTGGHPGDAIDTPARSFDNADVGSAGSVSFVATNDGAQWIVAALYTYAASGGGPAAATGNGNLAHSLGFAFAGSGAVQMVGVTSDTLKEPNEADQNVANASNVTVRVWHGSTITGAPDEVLTDQSITGGVLSFPVMVGLGAAVSYQARWTVSAEDRFFEVVNATSIDLNG